MQVEYGLTIFMVGNAWFKKLGRFCTSHVSDPHRGALSFLSRWIFLEHCHEAMGQCMSKLGTRKSRWLILKMTKISGFWGIRFLPILSQPYYTTEYWKVFYCWMSIVKTPRCLSWTTSSHDFAVQLRCLWNSLEMMWSYLMFVYSRYLLKMYCI